MAFDPAWQPSKENYGHYWKRATEKINTDSIVQRLTDALAGLAEITAVYTSKKEILFKATPVVSLEGMQASLQSRLNISGYKPELLAISPMLVVRLRSLEIEKSKKFPWLNLILFLVTGVSTIMAGALNENIDFISNPRMLLDDPINIFYRGLPFAISLLGILLFHEFGHYTASRIHGVNVSLPYFIPAFMISPIGTFGAFIKSKSAFINKRQLLDIGAAGPLSGLVIAIIVFSIGIGGSKVMPMPTDMTGAMAIGDSLLNMAITYIVKGPIPEGQTVFYNSVAFAGWVGIFVTMLNLLPIGQLDGGHIIYALFGQKQKYLANIVMVALIALSFVWLGWAFWLIMTLILKPAHPPTVMDELPLGPGRKLVGYLSIAVFILCFIPVPFAAP